MGGVLSSGRPPLVDAAVVSFQGLLQLMQGAALSDLTSTLLSREDPPSLPQLVGAAMQRCEQVCVCVALKGDVAVRGDGEGLLS